MKLPDDYGNSYRNSSRSNTEESPRSYTNLKVSQELLA